MPQNVPQHADRKRNIVQMFFGRPDDPALGRAVRAAISVALLLLVSLPISGLLRWMGLIPEEFPFSWQGFGEEMLVKPVGTFLIVLFLHLLRWLIRARRRVPALALAATTGPLCFFAGLMNFGSAQVFTTEALTSQAVVAWLGLFLVPAIFLGVVIQLESTWLRALERAA